MMAFRSLAAALGCLLLGVGMIGAQPEISSGRGYELGVGDVIGVETFQHDEISGEFQVEDDGAISFPLLGRVEVRGLTTAEVAQRLESRLEKDYYVDIQMQVDVKQYKSQQVTVLGEVLRPGTYYLQGHTTLTQMLSEAGGLKGSAGPTVELRRSVTVNGTEQQKVMTFSTTDVLSGKSGGEIEILAGDVLSVGAKQLYFITGEVARPGQYEISRGMTLMQAVTQAGGLGKFASQSVELHRDSQLADADADQDASQAGAGTSSSAEKVILKFDLARIRKGKDQDPDIRAGDVIIVKRRFF